MKTDFMKKELTALFLCAAVGLAQGPGADMRMGGPGRPGGPGGFGGRGMERFGGGVVAGAPYSAVEVLTIQEKFADGNSVNTTTSTQRARDSQGRTYMSETITPPAVTGKAPYTRITITDSIAGYRYELNSSTMTAIQSRLPKMMERPTATTSSSSGTAAARPAPGTTLGTVTRPNGAVVTTTSNGTATVNGVLATHTLVTEVIPIGAIGNTLPITTSRTTYVSPDLKIPVQIKTVDPRVGTSDMELTGITTGEPSVALFTVPAGYTIKKAGPDSGRGPGGGGPGGFGRPGRAPQSGSAGPGQ
jgi:hypothetical protein